ncbi:MAG: cation-transporting P-type ATPase [Candidatus Bathyarchaeota archaeon]|nr:cation-transporting P-type ATPase [Candidatus Termiticorpusculum sp.]
MSQWHSKQAQEIINDAEVNPEMGLTDEEAAKRLNQYGKNNLTEEHRVKFLEIFREEITEPMILLLFAIGVLYSVLGFVTGSGFIDAITIIVIIILLVLAEVYNEYRAKHSISALKQLAPPIVQVLRNGQTVIIQTGDLVPGDIVFLKVGQRVPADGRLLEAYGLEVDESSLTGESLPVAKDATAVLAGETRITDQTNMVFTGTVITRGRGKALITATGIKTELGRIVGITKAGKEPKTPLQLSMKQLSKTLVWVALFFSILIPLLSYLRGLQSDPAEAVLYGLSLAFVVIPEELPIIITMVLGVGSYALSRRGAIVKRLRAAETLGNVTVIATDKTGTITENKMRIEHLYFDSKIKGTGAFHENEKAALKTALLASDGIKPDSVHLGNPMAQAILEHLKQNGIDASTVAKDWIFKDEYSFDVNRKLASYIYKYGNANIVLSSGAPERLLANSVKVLLRGEETPLTETLRIEISQAITQMARAGERLLAFGYHRISTEQTDSQTNIEQDSVFVGIIGFIDPPRKETKNVIRTCQQAGIKVVMITGDHPETAKAIATQVGINSSNVLTGMQIAQMSDETLKEALKRTYVFARATPEDKLRLVKLLRENGEVVAVTGDGINDAPALKEAHIGIAMGVRGTDVAKEAADVILTNDNFAVIETAIDQGRKLNSNLRKGVRYYLACKVALVSIFLVPIILGIPLPFAPIQIIVLELFMDLAASATFIAEPAEKDSMKKKPTEKTEKFMNQTMTKGIFAGAASLFAAVTAMYLFTWFITQNVPYSQTVAFATWMFGHIFLAFNFRSEQTPLVKQGVLSNKVMLLWALLAIMMLLIGTNLAFIQQALQITSLNLTDWVLVILVSFVATFWMEIRKLVQRSDNF